jgi:hypothetical protein
MSTHIMKTLSQITTLKGKSIVARTRTGSDGIMLKALLATAIALGATGAVQAALMGHYEFEGNSNDSATSDGSQNLTLSGNAAVITPGIVGSGALGLDGAGDYASATGTNGFTSGASAVTISAWFTPDGAGNLSGNFGLVAMPIAGGSLGQNGATLEISGGRIQGGGRSSTSDGFQASTLAAVTLAAGTTYFAATVLDYPNDSIVVYLYNASTQTWASNTAAVAFAGATNSGNQGLWIGSRAVPDRFFDGVIDDVRVYNHGLSENEIHALVPEPATIMIALTGCIGLLYARRRHRRA